MSEDLPHFVETHGPQIGHRAELGQYGQYELRPANGKDSESLQRVEPVVPGRTLG